MVTLTIVFSLLSFSTVSAGQYSTQQEVELLDIGNWNYLGYSVFQSQSIIFHSTGGDFRVCLSYESEATEIQLWEQDPRSLDDRVDPGGAITPGKEIEPFECVIYQGVDDYVDGDNDLAELYIRKTSDGEQVKMYFYD